MWMNTKRMKRGVEMQKKDMMILCPTPFTLRVECTSFPRSQNSFTPLMEKIECSNCHNFGHVYATCRRWKHMPMWQLNQPSRGSNFRYTSSFNGYCSACNMFSQKAIDCRSSTWRWRSDMNNKRSYPLASYLVHIECYVCHNFQHMAKDCNMPISLRAFVQKL